METGLGLSVISDDPLGDLEDLLEWLRDEPELRGHLSQVEQPPPPGHMGGLTEIAIAAGGGGGVLVTVLATSLKAWLKRPRGADVGIKIRTMDGQKIEVNVKRADDVEELVTAVLERGLRK